MNTREGKISLYVKAHCGILQGKTQRLSIQTLRDDDVVNLRPRKILLDERNRAGTLNRHVRRLASYTNDSGSIWKLW